MWLLILGLRRKQNRIIGWTRGLSILVGCFKSFVWGVHTCGSERTTSGQASSATLFETGSVIFWEIAFGCAGQTAGTVL